MSRKPVVIAGVVLAVLLVLELAAVPLATRVIGTVLGRCVAYDHLEITAIARPVVPRLLVGRARDVELRATGVEAGEVRIAEAHLRLPEAVLPWALGEPEPATADLALRVEEPDVERALRAFVPFGLPVEVELRPDVATLGSPVVPLTLDVEVDVEPDGTVRLRPVRGGELLERLGLAQHFPPGAAARVTSLRIGAEELTGSLDLDVVPGVGGGEGCRMPVAVGSTVGEGAR